MQINLATRLTLARIPLGILTVLFLWTPFPLHAFYSFVCFVAAAATDYLDGHVARKYKQVTNLGIFLDPLIDKLTVLSVLIAFISQLITPEWIVILIFIREILVTSFRDYAAARGVAIPSVMSGKIKATLQYLGILFGLLALSCMEVGVPFGYVLMRFELFTLLLSIVIGYVGMFQIFQTHLAHVMQTDTPTVVSEHEAPVLKPKKKAHKKS